MKFPDLRAKSIADKYITQAGSAPVRADEGARILRAVDNFIGRFVVYPSEHARVAHALWISHTHLMDRWDSTPRLAFLSPEPASGKSRALEISELLVPRPVLAVNVSPAYLFRKVAADEGLPTILFDEVDTVFGPKAKENEEIRGLLNAGHRRDAVAGRCVVQGKTVVTEEIPAYAAVALAGLGWLPDTIMSRSVIIRMRRRAAEEKVEAFRRRIHLPEGGRLREQIESWASVQPEEIDWQQLELPLGVEDRAADVWEPLLAVADLAGGEWQQKERKAGVAVVGAANEMEPSLGIRLLTDIKTAFGDADSMATKTLLANLIAIEDSPWGDLRGKPLDERGLARRLKEYGIKSRNVRVAGAVVKGYARGDFVDDWKRYCLPLGAKSATSATSATSEQNQVENVADDVAHSGGSIRYTGVSAAGAVAGNVASVADDVADEAFKKTNKNGHCSAVADVADFSANGGYPCQECGQDDGQATLHAIDGAEVWLHSKCEAAWLKRDSAQAINVPAFLPRRNRTALS